MKKQLLLATALTSLVCFAAHADNSVTSLPAAPHAIPVINCEFPIPATTTAIDKSIIASWSEKAAKQAFEFNPATMDAQLEKLKVCFTDQGWQAFHEAMDKSGNINSIKLYNLNVSSKVDGNIKIDPVRENEWKVTLPLNVVYQNDKEKLTQQLSVELLVGRKNTGDLGIMQIIASLKDAAPNPETAAGTQAAAASASNSDQIKTTN